MELYEAPGNKAVVLFGFLGSTVRHRAKYAEVFTAAGDTKSLSSGPYSVLCISSGETWKAKMRRGISDFEAKAAVAKLQALQWPQTKQILVFIMSEGGMRNFIDASKLIEADPEMKEAWRTTVRAVVVDSAPGFFTIPRMAKAFDPRFGLIYYILYLFGHLGSFVIWLLTLIPGFTTLVKRPLTGPAMSKAREAVYARLFGRLPQLYLYGGRDDLCGHDYIGHWAQSQTKKLGADVVQTTYFADGDHVQLLRQYQEAYIGALDKFLAPVFPSEPTPSIYPELQSLNVARWRPNSEDARIRLLSGLPALPGANPCYPIAEYPSIHPLLSYSLASVPAIPSETIASASLPSSAAATQLLPSDTRSLGTAARMSDSPVVPPSTESPEELEKVYENPAGSEDRSSLLKLIGSAVGMDLTTFALPVYYNEPISMLQRLCEFMQYSHLLDMANDSEDPILRLAYVTAFAVSTFSSTERTQKPFNPLLGETFELVDEERGFKFIAEQVSHHPPIGASHCEGDKWTFWQEQEISSKFLGNSLDVTPLGVSHVILKSRNEYYKWANIKTVVHNVILGKIWVDHFGETVVSVAEASDFSKVYKRRVDVKYKQCGWFSRGYREVEGTALDDNGQPAYKLAGKWNEQLTGTSLQPHGNVAGPTILWRHTIKKTSDPRFAHSHWTEFTTLLVALDDKLKYTLPPSDSRLRPDRFALENKAIKVATKVKLELENKQRAQKKQRDELKLTYAPKFFEKRKAADGAIYWHFNGKYWHERQQRVKEGNKTPVTFNIDGGLPAPTTPAANGQESK